MAKTSVQKGTEFLALGLMTVFGFVMGLALFGTLYGWYLSGYADSETVLFTAIIMIVLIYAGFLIAYWLSKSTGFAYQKAVWMGVGFTMAVIIVAALLGYFGLTAPSISVGS